MSDPSGETSVWGIAGNIVGEHPSGPGGTETRRGTRLFRPGSKVYLASLRHHGELFPEVDDPRASIYVLGQHRNSREWLLSWVRAQYVTRWRVQLVYQPGALARLKEAGWPGFLLGRGEFQCSEGERYGEAATRALLDQLLALGRRRLNSGNPVAVVSAYRPDWVRCPGCGVRFSVRNPASWAGERHLTCGQALRVK